MKPHKEGIPLRPIVDFTGHQSMGGPGIWQPRFELRDDSKGMISFDLQQALEVTQQRYRIKPADTTASNRPLSSCAHFI